MMDPRALVAFVVQNLILLCFYILQQLPKEWAVRLDPDMLTRAITFEHEGRRINAGRWDLAPGHRRAGNGAWDYETGGSSVIDQDEVRSKAADRWDVYQQKVAMHIPSVGRKGGVFYKLPKPLPKDEKAKAKMERKKKLGERGMFKLRV